MNDRPDPTGPAEVASMFPQGFSAAFSPHQLPDPGVTLPTRTNPLATAAEVVPLLDDTLVAMSRAASRDTGEDGLPVPAFALGDWYEERGRDEEARLAREGLPLTALIEYVEGITGRKVRFRDLYLHVMK